MYMHSHAQLQWAVLDVGILFHSVTHLSPLRRCLLNKCLYCLHGQPRHFFIYTLWFFILFCFFVESKAFIHSPSEERGLVWRDTPALRGGALCFYWIIIGLKKGGGFAAVWPLGCGRLQFAPMLSSACGCSEQLVKSPPVLAFQ